MCIVFIKINPNPNPGEYYLVLANVRDEYLWRPTEEAHFWQDGHPTQILGGKDMQKGREGGTWLAMNTDGKIGSLLNILQPHSEISEDKTSRGFLVIDYLNSDLGPKQYLETVSQHSSEYNGFRMVGLQVNKSKVEEASYSNFDKNVFQFDSGVHAFGNNRIEGKLWPKVKNGKQMFENIVNKFDKIDSKELLIDDLFKLMSDPKKYELDEQMMDQGLDKRREVLERMNAINVMLSETQYGSRTRTLILIDSDFDVHYIEKTIKEPIVDNNIEWTNNEFKFKIK